MVFGAASLCRHCRVLLPAPGWGNPYVIDRSILDLARPRCSCCKLERCGGRSHRVARFWAPCRPALLSLMSVRCADRGMRSFSCTDWSFSFVCWVDVFCSVRFRLVNPAWMPEMTCKFTPCRVQKLVLCLCYILHCCCVQFCLKWNLEISRKVKCCMPLGTWANIYAMIEWIVEWIQTNGKRWNDTSVNPSLRGRTSAACINSLS